RRKCGFTVRSVGAPAGVGGGPAAARTMRPMVKFTMPDTLPEGDEKVAAVRSMFDAVAPRYDLVNRIMTFRLDVRWRRLAIGSLALRRDSLVVDLACGTGDLCRELEATGLAAVGVDLSFGMLAAARTDAPLVQGDALR